LPFEQATLAIIADESAFRSRSGLDKLVIDIFRSDGLQHAQVVLEWRVKRE
jgi:hypothetical protein